MVSADESSCQPMTNARSDAPFVIRAHDLGFEAHPCISAGLRHFKFENVGEHMHEVMFIKLPETMTPDAYRAAVRAGTAFPEGALDYSGLALTSPGQEAEFWLHLDPGRYLLFCWYKGHSTDLPAHELLVVEDDAPDSLRPHSDVTVRLIDFRFEIEGEFRTGSQVVRFDNVGPTMHEADIFRFTDDSQQEDLIRWYGNDRRTPAPVTGHSGVLDSHQTGTTVWVKTSLPAGRYILWCNLPMSGAAEASTVTHATVGMFYPFEVMPPEL